MKKNYFKPEVAFVDIAIDTIMQSASAGGTINPGGSGKPRSNENRGDWGNVWGNK